MKKVFDNGMVAHVWAQQEQSEGRSHNGNFWFNGSAIYSYRTPIANIVAGADGSRVCLITSESFSMTTSSKHMPSVWRAVRHLPSFCVPFVGINGGRGPRWVNDITDPQGIHAANLAFLVSNYETLKGKIKRARDWHDVTNSLHGSASEAIRYAEAFGLPSPALTPEADAQALISYRAEREARNATPEAQAKRERERANREARKARKEAEAAQAAYEKMAEARAKWLAGEYVASYGLRLADDKGGALLRVRGDNLETSWNANVPLDHATRAFRFIKQCRDTGKQWETNGHTIPVGHFKIERITPEGDIKAGCHVIHWGEISRIASALGLFE